MSLETSDTPSPLYARVKQHILDRIASGEWRVGAQIPSENDLVESLSVSRMTINRALRELATDGHLSRVQGIGTFVQAPPVRNDFLEIRDIAEDLAARGLAHRADVVKLEITRADPELAMTFDLRPGAKIFHSVIVHFEDEVPIQLEERFISPAFAPAYLEQDFTRQSTTRYLQSISKATEVEHIVFAMKPNKETHQLLQVGLNDACLLLVRRTWVNGMPATKSMLTYPGSRFSLGTRYKTSV
ncbi:MAG: histidine utilization repressor [Janthinobacterium lividum]